MSVFKKTISLLLCLVMLVGTLASCDMGQGSGDGGGDGQVCEAHTPNDSGACTVCGLQQPYSLIFVSNGDATCYVSNIITYPAFEGRFVLEIPETSPDGDRVTEIRYAGFEKPIPRMLLPKDYEEIAQRLRAKVDSGEIVEYYYAKFFSFFSPLTLNQCENADEKEHMLQQYPITAISDVYIYDERTTEMDDLYIIHYLLSYIGYEARDLAQDYQNLRDAVTQSSAENKEEILANLPEVGSVGIGISEILLPEGIENVDISLYSTCYNLEKLTLPTCIIEIPEYCFYYTNLKSVTLPDSITIIGDSAFAHCAALTDVTLGKGVEEIEISAFFRCESLTRIAIPESITNMDPHVFATCTSLAAVVIPSTMTKIPHSTFAGCSNLTAVYYAGGADAWSLVTVEDAPSEITNATVYFYSETQPTAGGNYWHYVDGVPTAW